MRRYFPYILISVVILVAVFGPLGARLAHAGANLWEVLSAPGMAVKTLLAHLVLLIFNVVSIALSISGYFLDVAINYSINELGSQSKIFVESGWTICRDVANLFFIFILLYIAIATILQLSGYGMKELLTRVIIVALLVNFSLVVTGFIIDGSNILAMEFYSKITNIKTTGGESISLSEAIVAGIKPQTIYTDEVIKDGNDETLVQIIITLFFGIIIILVTSFILFAAGVLFVIRTAVLWILMILSPLAFLFMALPKTQQYAKQWWDKLFNQSFFAPAYLFLIYLVVKIISEGSISSSLKLTNETFGSAFGTPDNANVGLVINFCIIIVLMVASLIIAKQMGAVGSSTVMGWGNKMKGAAQGYAGKISKRGAGYLSEKMLQQAEKKPEGRIAGILGTVPGLTRGLSRASSWREKQIKEKAEDYTRTYGSYSSTALEAMLRDPRITKAKRDVITKLLVQREIGGVKKVSTEDIDKELLSLRGDKSDAANARRVELVIKREQEKKKFGVEEKEPGPKPSPGPKT